MQKTYILNPNTKLQTLTALQAQRNGVTRHGVTDASRGPALQAVANRGARPKPALPRPSLPPRQPLPEPVLDPTKPRLQLGLDVHLEFIMAVAQRGNTSAHAPRKFTPEQLVGQIRQWVAQGLQVFCVQESCGFGFVLHRQMVAAGALSFLITPIALNGKRKTDKLDPRALCLRLSRYLDGNRDELAPIRIPTGAEQRRREGTRRRQFLAREIRCLANRGHAQVAEYCHQSLPSRWWGPRLWKKLSTKLDAWLLGVPQKLRDLILALETQLKALEEELLHRLQGQDRSKGLGELTLVTLDGEICDWARFHNRKQVGSYTGCCPGEHSSGGKPLVGSIDRMGNGRVRALLVEAVWRFLTWQPNWKAAQRMKVKLADGPPMRKKTVIALARQLAVDLWRWRTGRCTLADLGLIPA
ncbi:MAG TPA: IS110 family transposase [Verrucomicrobiota bacterium]|nr:IS110 family transposase [Verrucomicrobiota bacterium]